MKQLTFVLKYMNTFRHLLAPITQSVINTMPSLLAGVSLIEGHAMKPFYTDVGSCDGDSTICSVDFCNSNS